MKIFLTGPDAESEAFRAYLTSAGYEVIVRQPRTIEVSVLETLDSNQRAALIELVVKASVTKRSALSLTIQGKPVVSMAGS